VARLRDRPPEVGDRLSRIAEPPPWLEAALEDFWRRVRAQPGLLTAGTVLPWVIGPGPRPSNTSRMTRTLYAPDNPQQKTQAPGKDVKAYKRMLSRAGFWKWQEFDTTYSDAFAHGATGPTGSGPGVDGFRAALGTGDGSGTLNERTYHALLYGKVPADGEHAGEWICDPTSENLLEEYRQAWIADNPPPKAHDEPAAPSESADAKKARVRSAMADYCRRSIANEPGIHYQQLRPVGCFGVKPESGFTTDCSGHSTCVYYWARQATGIAVPDPNGNGFSGYGYTGTLIDNPRCSPKYLVGDLGIYGASAAPDDTEHVVTCYAEGDGDSSKWCSHGSEAAPYSVALHYRSDLVAVVRPPLLP
jgi:hypothetical protein